VLLSLQFEAALQMMQTPMMQQLLSNPETLRNMLQMTPGVREVGVPRRQLCLKSQTVLHAAVWFKFLFLTPTVCAFDPSCAYVSCACLHGYASWACMYMHAYVGGSRP
jgi:hypothetical protein